MQFAFASRFLKTAAYENMQNSDLHLGAAPIIHNTDSEASFLLYINFSCVNCLCNFNMDSSFTVNILVYPVIGNEGAILRKLEFQSDAVIQLDEGKLLYQILVPFEKKYTPI